MSPTSAAIGLGPGPLVLALLVAGVLGLSWLTVRLGATPSLDRWRRWLHVSTVLAWIAVIWLVGLRALAVDSIIALGARSLLLIAAVIVAAPLGRDVLAGLALALEGRLRVGDELRVAGARGRIAGFGLRSLVLREADGRTTSVPYRRLAAELVAREPGPEAAVVELDLALARRSAAELDAVRARLLEAAILSPYAAPGRRPEVAVVADARGEIRIRVHGFACDRSLADRYRGDVLARAELLDDPDPRG